MNNQPDWRELAPAKINLALDVLRKRDDGYHEVRMIMQSLQLADELTFWCLDNNEIELDGVGVAMLCSKEDNLIYKAAMALRKYCGLDYGVKIKLQKNIPVAAGLAGGSADAAAVLRGLNVLWELALKENELQGIAASIGSDVAFCLAGGTQLAEGRGENLTVLKSLPTQPLVLVKPAAGLATASVYNGLRFPTINRPQINEMMVAIAAVDWSGVLVAMGNVLESVSESLLPEIGTIKRAIREGDESCACMMSGSGPTVFAIAKSKVVAEKMANRLKAVNASWQIIATATREE